MTSLVPKFRGTPAFTLVEIMIVVAILAIVLAAGIPAFVTAMRQEGMRRAVTEVTDACGFARAQAILHGRPAMLRIRPGEGVFEVPAGGRVDGEGPGQNEQGGDYPRNGSMVGRMIYSARLPENVGIELLGVNFVELQDAEEARVWFFPNGMSDEFTVVLRSDRDEWRQISLEVVTGLAEVTVIK
jgi:prepilin-type N-terminal cleavage/methylation domain-containing protein